MFDGVLFVEARPASLRARSRLLWFLSDDDVKVLGRFTAVAGVAILLGRFAAPSVGSDRLTAAPLSSALLVLF